MVFFFCYLFGVSGASSADCHRLLSSPPTTTVKRGGERFYNRNSCRVCLCVCVTMLEPQEQQKPSGSDYSRINHLPARAMMPIPPDVVASNNGSGSSSSSRTRPAIGAKPVPPPKPFPRPPPCVRPPAALPPRPSSSVPPSCYVMASNCQQQQRRRPLTCVNDMAQNPLYMCRLSVRPTPVRSSKNKLVSLSTFIILFYPI